MDRIAEIAKPLPKNGRGLELSPLFRPVIKRPEYNVDYTDYMSTAGLRERDHAHPDIGNLVDIDFVWTPGKRLKDCATFHQYDYAVSSHVWEHVPNPIGWLEQVLEVCREGAMIRMALPTKYNPIDFIRRETDISEWVGAYLEDRSTPSAKQVFDCLYNSRNTSHECNKAAYTPEQFAAFPSNYPGQTALEFAYRAATQNVYTDVHCSVFVPETFPNLIRKIKELGLLNIELVDVSYGGVPVEQAVEFFVTMRKQSGGTNSTIPARMQLQVKQTKSDSRMRARVKRLLQALGLYHLVRRIAPWA